MSDFAPSTAAARTALGDSTPIVTRKHPGGAKGARISLHEVARRIRDGRLDPRVRVWAIQQLHKAGRPTRYQERAQAILDGLRKKALYIPDPTQAEVIQSAALTLCLDPQGSLCFLGGDCDDLVVAFGSATMSVGIPTHVVGQAFDGSNTPTHVIAAIQAESGDWLRADPSHERLPVGQAIHATGEISLDPLDDEDCGLAGESAQIVASAGAKSDGGGDYVGVGAMPDAGMLGSMQRSWIQTPYGWRHTDRLVGVGEVGGLYSISDLKAIIAAKDYQLAQLAAHGATAAATWGLQDIAAYKDWQSDYGALSTRYIAAKDSAKLALAAAALNFLMPEDADGSGDPGFRAIMAAIHHDPEQKGDLTDLDRRLQLATGTPTDYSNNPQPKLGSDFDLNLYKATGKALDDLGLPKTPAVPGGLLPALPWGKIGLIGGAVLLGLVVVNKVINKVL